MNKLQKAVVKLLGLKADNFVRNTSFEIINGQIISSPDNKKSYLTNGYNINDIIYSVVQLIAEKVKVAPWGPYKVEDEQALKQYLAIMRQKGLTAKEYVIARDLRKKALEPYTKDGILNDLFEHPNDSETFSDIAGNTTINKLLTGDRMIWAELLESGADKGKPLTLNILPSQEVGIVANLSWPMKILGYKLDAWGLINIPKENVLHDKYYNPNFDTAGNHLFGLAPMKAALALTDRSNSENKYSTAGFQNGGPRTIIFVDEPTFSGAEKGAHASQIKKILTGKEYAGSNNANKLASSGYKMGAVPLGLSPVEMEVIESEKWSLRRFCNVFGGVPSQLLNDPDNKVYSNSVEGEKALTTRCAIPQLNSFRDHLNRKLATDWGYKGKNIFIDYDMSVFTELQEDLGKKWGYVKELPVPNRRKLEMMGEDIPEGYDEFMNQILVPSGFELSETFGENETDRALAAGDEEIPD